MTRTLLYLAYFFPPRGGAGVQRSVKFVKYLPQFGWRPIVVANGGVTRDTASAVEDQTLVKDISPEAVVEYTSLNELEMRTYAKSQSKWRQRLCVTDPMGWWVKPAVRLGLELIEKHRPEVILVTMSPFSAWRAGLELKQRTGLPLVLDLRDPWALDETRIYPTKWHAKRDRAEMARAFAAADRIILNTPESAKRAASPFNCASKITWITNGYDAEDFSGNRQLTTDNSLRIVHTGMFHSELAQVWDDLFARRGLLNKLKHSPRPINLWTRTPRYLLAAMEQAIARGDIPKGMLQLILAGEISPGDRALIESSPVSGMVKMLGYLPHADSVSQLQNADLLFLPNHTPLDGGPTLIVPGKTYEYLGSGTPILCMAPMSDMRDFVEQTHSGVTMNGDDVQAAAKALVDCYRAKQSGHKLMQQDRNAVQQFERKELTSRLAVELQTAIGNRQILDPR